MADIDTTQLMESSGSLSMQRIAQGPKNARVILVNLFDMEEFEVLSNPATFTAKVGVNWQEQAIVGMSHKLLQYKGTNNWELPVDFHLNAITAASRGDMEPDILNFQRFLMAFTVAPIGAETILQGSPPSMLFLWPSLGVSIKCKLKTLAFEYQRISILGRALVYTAKTVLVEDRDARVGTVEVRARGLMRSSLNGTGG